MKNLIQQTSLIIVLSSGSTSGWANITETTESGAPTTYCVSQTLIRGGYENLVIDHNMIVPAIDHAKVGDIFVGARLKSQPDALWLLSGITWRKIESSSDLPNSQYQHYDELPLVAPISIFNSPMDLRANIGDIEIWVGYGLRSVTEPAEVSFNEMANSARYELLWESLPLPYLPLNGIHSPLANICLETTKVMKIIKTATPNTGGSTVLDDAQ